MRGYGNGQTVNTLAGDHLDRPTDYTPLVIGVDTEKNAVVELMGTIGACNKGGSGEKAFVCYPIDDGRALEKNQNGSGIGPEQDPAFTLDTIGAQSVAIAFPANLSGTQCASSENVSPSLGHLNQTAVALRMAVRRLTPLECERLMGFRDNYTLVPHRGKPMKDGPRYKLCGNSMVRPCMEWIGKRIQRVEKLIRRK